MLYDRIALIGELVELAALKARPGRTAIMKYLYFLKVLKQVPLPYEFGLYTYGPFDSVVLDDLKYAEALYVVTSTLVQYSNARGYEYQAGQKLNEVKSRAHEFLSKHQESINSILDEFGGRSAIDLEMASTIVFIDRNTSEAKAKITIEDLAKKVFAVKPHLLIQNIESEARSLKEKKSLTAVL